MFTTVPVLFFASKSIITWNQLATFKSWSSYPQFVLALASKARMALVINHKEGQVANKKTSNAMIGARGLCVWTSGAIQLSSSMKITATNVQCYGYHNDLCLRISVCWINWYKRPNHAICPSVQSQIHPHGVAKPRYDVTLHLHVDVLMSQSGMIKV